MCSDEVILLSPLYYDMWAESFYLFFKLLIFPYILLAMKWLNFPIHLYCIDCHILSLLVRYTVSHCDIYIFILFYAILCYSKWRWGRSATQCIYVYTYIQYRYPFQQRYMRFIRGWWDRWWGCCCPQWGWSLWISCMPWTMYKASHHIVMTTAHAEQHELNAWPAIQLIWRLTTTYFVYFSLITQKLNYKIPINLSDMT